MQKTTFTRVAVDNRHVTSNFESKFGTYSRSKDVDSMFDEAQSYARDLSEHLERTNGDNPYTMELESFLENVFEPLFYEELEKMVEDEDSDLEENPLIYKERYERDLGDIGEELEYWGERLDSENMGMDTISSIPGFTNALDEIMGAEELNIENVYAPVVEGIHFGIIARDVLGADLGYVGFSEERDVGFSEERGPVPRPVSFNTLDGKAPETDILITDDVVQKGDSAVGVHESIKETKGRSMVATAYGRYEFDPLGGTYEITEESIGSEAFSLQSPSFL